MAISSNFRPSASSSSADGDGKSYKLVVFGGYMGRAAGRMLAQAHVEHGFSAIFDAA